MRCIYCKEEKNSTDFSNREHVIPAGIGTFGAGIRTPTLINLVCNTCNQAMGNDLETPCIRETYLELYRSGAIGTLRYQNPKLESKQIKRSQFIDLRAVITKDAKDKYLVTLTTGNNTSNYQNSVNFRQDDEGDHWEAYSYDYLLKNRELLKSLREKSLTLKNKENSINIIYVSEESLIKIKHLLDSVGYKASLNLESNPIGNQLPSKGQIPIEISLTINDVFFRFLAKIAFNYFVKYALSKLPIDIYDKAIDELRYYIRFGMKYKDLDFTPIHNPRILGQDKNIRFPNCFHLICIEYKDNRFRAYINLYNSAGYELNLFKHSNATNGYFIGHHFDFIHKNVRPITLIKNIQKKGIILVSNLTRTFPKIKIIKPKIFLP